MTQESKSKKPNIDFEAAMRRTHDRYDDIFKALAELERRELAESRDVNSELQIFLSDDPQTKK